MLNIVERERELILVAFATNPNLSLTPDDLDLGHSREGWKSQWPDGSGCFYLWIWYLRRQLNWHYSNKINQLLTMSFYCRPFFIFELSRSCLVFSKTSTPVERLQHQKRWVKSKAPTFVSMAGWRTSISLALSSLAFQISFHTTRIQSHPTNKTVRYKET